MEKDIFCKIIDGEIPCHKLYEDDDVLAFLDISQVTKGHALVISKKHYENFLTIPQEEMHKVMDVAQRIGQVAIKYLGAKGVNILSNCYEAAGQTVMHFHVHVIPRYDDNEGFILEMKSNEGELNLPAIAREITEILGVGEHTSITVAMVVLTGVVGALLAPPLIKLFGSKEDTTIGMALGSASHAIGTSVAFGYSSNAGAIASVSMVTNGFLTVLVAVIVRLITAG